MRHKIGIEAIRLIAQLPTADTKVEPAIDFAWRRRICFIYGVGTCYSPPDGTRCQAGWNRVLLNDCQEKDPEAATDEIFRRVWEKARQEFAPNVVTPEV